MSVGQLARDCTGVVSLLWLRKFHNRNTVTFVTNIRAEMMKPSMILLHFFFWRLKGSPLSSLFQFGVETAAVAWCI